MNKELSTYISESKGILKKDLVKINNLKEVFNEINQHMYGKLKYTHTDTRARSKEIINLLFCKLVDEFSKSDEEFTEFCIKNKETEEDLFKRLNCFFKENVIEKYRNLINHEEKINLNKDLLYIIIQKLQKISLIQSSKDIIRDAFEIFVSKILKDEGGQFFTPLNIIKFMVGYLDPILKDKILDPACGHGGFLLEAKDYLWAKNPSEKDKINIISNLYGIDKDLFLAKICKLHLEILSNGKSNIFCENSLDPSNYNYELKNLSLENKFDIILTNPPFGVKIPIDNKSLLQQYELGHIWINDKNNHWSKTKKIQKKQPPQILFIERCIQLLKNGGKLGIVLPEGIFGNPTDRYIWEFLEQNGKILGIVSLDQNTFQPYTCNKTSILFYQKINKFNSDYFIDFAIVNNVGHDKDGKICYKRNKDGTEKRDLDGKKIINDDLDKLINKITTAEEFNYKKHQNVFKINLSKIKNKIFIPNYYIGVEKTLKNLSTDNRFILFSIQDLVERKIIYTNKNKNLPRGDEIGSNLYGLGDIPFIRTSEISNWEINIDSNKRTSEEIYLKYKDSQNIEFGDILVVKDGGPNLIGKTGFITRFDTKIIIQSHLYQIKVLKNNELIDPYLILYLLNLDIVQKQFEAITFIQGTIATIGNRIMEIILPLPSDLEKRRKISTIIKDIIDSKEKIREKINTLDLKSFI